MAQRPPVGGQNRAIARTFTTTANSSGQVVIQFIARTFTTTANSSGQVVIQFIARTENPKINGITVTG